MSLSRTRLGPATVSSPTCTSPGPGKGRRFAGPTGTAGFVERGLVLKRSKPANPVSSPVSLPQTSWGRHVPPPVHSVPSGQSVPGFVPPLQTAAGQSASATQAVATVTLQCDSDPSGSVVGPIVVWLYEVAELTGSMTPV